MTRTGFLAILFGLVLACSSCVTYTDYLGDDTADDDAASDDDAADDDAGDDDTIPEEVFDSWEKFCEVEAGEHCVDWGPFTCEEYCNGAFSDQHLTCISTCYFGDGGELCQCVFDCILAPE
jgi:hypothetical protein